MQYIVYDGESRDVRFEGESSPFLFRGTRVWIFCSRLRTLARISDTICTPLFLAKDPEDEVLRIEDVLQHTSLYFSRQLVSGGNLFQQ
jgi:hypothetical protein